MAEKNGVGRAINFDMLFPPEMAQKAAVAGVKKVQMDFVNMLLLGALAGFFIGLGANFYTITQVGSSALPFGVGKIMGGLAFCIGLILVIVGGAELFTGNTLIVMAVLCRKIALRWLFRSWIIVFVGNFIGSVVLALLVWGTDQQALAGGAVGQLAMKIGEAKCSLGFWPAVFRGILCNSLVCWAIWMCFSSRSTTDRILAIIFPITAFVACGFEHCVANMYFVPVALFLKAQAGATEFANLMWYNFFVANLIPVTIGNIIGGAGLVGVVLWTIYHRREPKYRESMN